MFQIVLFNLILNRHINNGGNPQIKNWLYKQLTLETEIKSFQFQ